VAARPALPPIAVIADAHVHDTAGDPTGQGVILGGQRHALRPWADTRTAPRAVNESAGVLEAALQRIHTRGIRQVVLLGDYTDEGTAAQTRALAARLARWRDHRGMVFHALPGNHDLFAVAGKHTATRIATGPDSARIVTSDPSLAAQDPGAILAPDWRRLGQADAMAAMAGFGYARRPGDLHWESPFGPDDALAARTYPARAEDEVTEHRLIDASYLVEPVPGLWLLMIDANVFDPAPGIADPTRKRAFRDPSDAGWNALARVKPHLPDWIARVTRRAEESGRVLLTFSHYPVLDPYGDDGSEHRLFGHSTILRRTPGPEVAAMLAAAGLRWHMGGHMHTCNRVEGAGGLVDVAAPSLVAWPPGFMVVHPDGHAPRVETVSLADLPPDPGLAGFYRASGAGDAADLPLGPFLAAQARARAGTHHLPRHWSPAHATALSRATLADLMALMQAGTGALIPGAGRDAALATIPAAELVEDWIILRQGGNLTGDAVPDTRLRAYRQLITAIPPRATGDAAHFATYLRRLAHWITRAGLS
jgi:3',5'-cyclic AMP phosphodiesterase CpdA